MHHDPGIGGDNTTGTTLKSLELPSYLASKFGQNVGLEREKGVWDRGRKRIRES